ncbi:hypothetical protein P3X46_001516 [Hevea brasiliensis]|uniref:PWWP domain-containing protein n=1 Tax=Hevea brasiliensis TaxID=3981 RepID=A0ABQ9NGC3_HEVBR|nr:uncharacterized protein At1g51745 [Hevea brasiliensis]XP_021645546.2 uncharacterized protein At1g51745 [Hevea brasiliensis]XP_021645547.2 uncharacterized protein At1g51745 [Hevea brasiliensis]XP_021645548.2 uncharacterized protein At1g51745 [Hevea brasiliensis]XP_021645549.2 uncharacterized protein At1g51745 [Hevea brasiliensis]XP_058006499.1 uncharacterized protein At1g51745 [Hevea brasiliensis]KAJ9190297.1 hypothetical protein P3X46_001516 [Hevea brasiliensis]KAJ9190298.1 hypothetical p
MGSSDDPNNNSKAIDASVGGLVWVRRRNGSWWPGRIMGLDEISEGSLVSPRSGTPVKLLGREDASVDWYNLEKSKRVKAFRCGEYDECIEKAKANAANGNKKAVKYARREDAILHALEIENARLGKDCIDFFSSTNNSVGEVGSSAKELASISGSGKEDVGMTEEESDSGATKDKSDSDSAPELSQSGISFEEPNHFGASKVQSVQGKRRKTPNDSEDDGTEGIKRMRGLEDLGMVVGDSNAGNCLSNGSPINGSKGYNLSMKRKRSQVANVHELLKRKNRCRPLTKVLENTAMVSVPVICDRLPNSSGSPLNGFSDSKVSGIDSNESRKSICVVVNNNSDSTGVSCENGASLNPSEHAFDASHIDYKLRTENDAPGVSGFTENDSLDRLFDVPFVGEDKHSAGFSPMVVSSSGKHQVGGLGRQSSQSSQAEAVSLKNEGLNESVSASSAATHANNISQRMEKGTSKWQLKGKRNSRHINKNRKQDKRKYMAMDDEPDAYLAGIEHLDGFFSGSDQKVDCDGTRRSLASYSCNLQVKTKQIADDEVDGVQDWSKPFSLRESHIRGGMVEVSLPPQRSLPYRQSRFTVNSRYQMSDFPGRNINDSKLYDVKVEVRANYQPQNVPLVSLMSKLNGKAIIGRPLTVEVLDDGYCDLIGSNECDPTHVSALEGTGLGHAAMRNSEPGRIPAKHMTMQLRFSPSKSPKRKCGLLSKKIRKLSSLTGNKDERKPVVEKLRGPVIVCVPLKLVFSRINEAVNGSARQTHRALTSSNS